VAAKLLSAAAWRHLGFESDPLQNVALSRQSLPNCAGTGSSTDVGAGRVYSAGEWMGEVLLSSGGFLPSHHCVIQLLGGAADVLLPVVTDKSAAVSHRRFSVIDTVSHCDLAPAFVSLDEQDTAGNDQGSLNGLLHSREPGPDGQTGPTAEVVAARTGRRVFISGWCPCLYHEVYQDVELA
jgi:hypothetical protein